MKGRLPIANSSKSLGSFPSWRSLTSCGIIFSLAKSPVDPKSTKLVMSSLRFRAKMVYITIILNILYQMLRKLFISSDHGGFEMKNAIRSQLERLRDRDDRINRLEIIDIGPTDLDPGDDYPHFAFSLANQVVAGSNSEEKVFGILICRSGVGMSIAANKVDGAYAALCDTVDLAKKARAHNDANILVLDSDYDHEDPIGVVLAFLTTEFSGGRHERRIEQIKDFELQKSGEPLG